MVAPMIAPCLTVSAPLCKADERDPAKIRPMCVRHPTADVASMVCKNDMKPLVVQKTGGYNLAMVKAGTQKLTHTS